MRRVSALFVFLFLACFGAQGQTVSSLEPQTLPSKEATVEMTVKGAGLAGFTPRFFALVGQEIEVKSGTDSEIHFSLVVPGGSSGDFKLVLVAGEKRVETGASLHIGAVKSPPVQAKPKAVVEPTASPPAKALVKPKPQAEQERIVIGYPNLYFWVLDNIFSLMLGLALAGATLVLAVKLRENRRLEALVVELERQPPKKPKASPRPKPQQAKAEPAPTEPAVPATTAPATAATATPAQPMPSSLSTRPHKKRANGAQPKPEELAEMRQLAEATLNDLVQQLREKGGYTGLNARAISHLAQFPDLLEKWETEHLQICGHSGHQQLSAQTVH